MGVWFQRRFRTLGQHVLLAGWLAVTACAQSATGAPTANSEAPQNQDSSSARMPQPDAQPAAQPAAPQPDAAQPADAVEQRSVVQPARRVPGQQVSSSAALVGMVQSRDGIPLGGVMVTLQQVNGRAHPSALTSGDGIFRLRGIPPGNYEFTFLLPGFQVVTQKSVSLKAGEVLTIEVRLTPAPGGRPKPVPERPTSVQPGNGEQPPEEMPSYREISRRPDETVPLVEPQSPQSPPYDKIMAPLTDRWDINMPPWKRYDRYGEYPYASSHWYDPFNRNKYKGDYPIFGQYTFFNFTGNSTTATDVRTIFNGSGVSAQHPGSFQFFGKDRQVFLSETVRLSFNLFHGDTSFKPIDWQVRFTPAFNVNQLWTEQRGIVNIDVRRGNDRVDTHIGLQEAFVEKKIADLSPNYDFISVRAGIQQFASDFRGFVFNEEQPGVRIFGNLRSNRIQYNAAYFYFLEKNTNSELNTFEKRDQQVMIANMYFQDFLAKGYTAEVSYLFNKDDGGIHFDDNGFLVRPSPIGNVVNGKILVHNIHAHYIGLTGNGHIGRWNVSNAFYQALGHDTLNPVAGKRVVIDAQLAALELSYDRDWIRFRASGFFASGDSNPRDHVARGFDDIVDEQNFGGSPFTYFNREGIQLGDIGVALTSPDSFLTNLRSNKSEGQANFVNPGIFLFNVGSDISITPDIKGFVNANYMRFHHVAPLELLLFQSNIPSDIGVDYSIGATYRPKLNDNIIFTAGVSALTPGAGLRKIDTNQTLFSFFTIVRFQF